MERRVAVIDGVRTPFVKADGAFCGLDALELAQQCVAELVARNAVDADAIDALVFGRVIASTREHNIAREVVLGTGLAPTIEARSVSQACITSYRSVADAAAAIAAGTSRCAVAGGADSASATPLVLRDEFARALKRAARASGPGARLRALLGLRPRHLVPRPPRPTELSTGLTMGESAEKMAWLHGIGREEQDDFAHRSHVRAARAWRDGAMDDEVVPVVPAPGRRPVARDDVVRFDSDREAYRRLSPAFDPRGTITAGNASPLTDGAAAVLLADEESARAWGLEPLGYVGASVFVAVDPRDELLIGPAVAIPRLLERTGLALDDFDLIDMHEAFAAQVLAVLDALESDAFARASLGREERVGTIDRERLNVDGGSIAIGHPFAATGARQIGQALRALRRCGGRRALCTACAAGGLAAALVLEAP